MPANVPKPEDLEPDETVYARLAEKQDISERYRRGMKDMIEVRKGVLYWDKNFGERGSDDDPRNDVKAH